MLLLKISPEKCYCDLNHSYCSNDLKRIFPNATLIILIKLLKFSNMTENEEIVYEPGPSTNNNKPVDLTESFRSAVTEESVDETPNKEPFDTPNKPAGNYNLNIIHSTFFKNCSLQ